MQSKESQKDRESKRSNRLAILLSCVGSFYFVLFLIYMQSFHIRIHLHGWTGLLIWLAIVLGCGAICTYLTLTGADAVGPEPKMEA